MSAFQKKKKKPMTKYIICLRLLEQELVGKRLRLWLFRCQDMSGKNQMKYKSCPYQEIAVIHHFGFSVSLSSISYIYLAMALFTPLWCLVSFVYVHLNDQMFLIDRNRLLAFYHVTFFIIVHVPFCFTYCNSNTYWHMRVCVLLQT